MVTNEENSFRVPKNCHHHLSSGWNAFRHLRSRFVSFSPLFHPWLQNPLINPLNFPYIWKQSPRCEFRSAARVGPSGHGWPYSGDQGLVTIVGPTVVVSVLPTLAANTGNRRCARPSAQLWPRLELTVGPTLANCFR